MLRKTQSTFNFLVLVFSLGACGTLTAPPKEEPSAPPLEKVFNEKYEDVWKATQLAVSRYPMKINEIDSGIFETQFIRGEKAWVSPHTKSLPSGGQRYKISIRMIKGQSSQGEPAIKVTILKRGEIQRDFFSDFDKVPSDGLEEKSLMYRIERELEVEHLMKKLKKT